MFGRMPVICACACIAIAATSIDEGQFPERFRLSCWGTLAAPADSATLNSILADGLVDVAGGTVVGFGLGGQPIHSVSDRRITFGGGVSRVGDRIVEGFIDRQTLATHILVNSMQGAETPVMAMVLDCRIALPLA
jgi:hypothetical protein